MSITKTPFLSLGSQGTIANTLTTQRRGGKTVVRTKPLPAYRYTLPQAYQRWLYEDYAYQWTQLSEAERRVWHAAGSRKHLTGYSAFLSYSLKNLPDIAAWYKSDLIIAGAAPDSSRNANTGVIFGCSSAPGAIDHAYVYDGINNRVEIPHSPSISLASEFTLESLVWPGGVEESGYILAKHQNDAQGGFGLHWNGVVERLTLYNGNLGSVTSDIVFTDSRVWVHVACRKKSDNTITFFRNGVPAGAGVLPISENTIPLFLGARNASFADSNMWEGYLDNIILYNRPEDDATILRHAGRRYPV